MDANGIARRVPEPGFASAGLDPLVDWLTVQVREVYQELQQDTGDPRKIKWYYARENKQMGPVSAAELKRLATTGELNPDDRVWRQGMGTWDAARNVPGLFDIIVDPPPPPPPPSISGQLTGVAMLVAVVLFLLFVFAKSCFHDTPTATPTATATIPQPVLSGGHVSVDKGEYFDDLVTVTGSVQMTVHSATSPWRCGWLEKTTL